VLAIRKWLAIGKFLAVKISIDLALSAIIMTATPQHCDPVISSLVVNVTQVKLARQMQFHVEFSRSLGIMYDVPFMFYDWIIPCEPCGDDICGDICKMTTWMGAQELAVVD